MTYFLPAPRIEDTSADKDNGEHITKQVMGEEIDHLTKLVSTCNINHNFAIMAEVITFLGNFCTWPHISWDLSKGKPSLFATSESSGTA